MPTPGVARYKLTCFGTIHNGVWQTSLVFAVDRPDMPYQPDLDLLITLILADGAAWKTRWQSLNASQCSWTGVRVDVYPPGSLAVGRTSQGLFASAIVGSSTTESAPASSLVATLNTAHPGRSGRGRMYWPMTGPYTVAGSPAGLPSALVTGCATDFAAYVTQLNSHGGVTTVGNLDAVVQSMHDGQLYLVTNVTIDGRPDRQEHRERRLTFAKSSHAV